jgi:folate-binding protein YgfZ
LPRLANGREVSDLAVETHNPNVANDYRAAREQAAWIDVSDRAKVELRGADRVSFLQNFCTNDVVKLPAGGGCEAFLTTAQAKLLARLLIYKSADAIRLDADAGLGLKIIEHLERYVITEQVELFNHTDQLVQFHLTGPRAPTILAQILSEGPPQLNDLQHSERTIDNFSLQVRRNDALGQPGYDLLCPQEHRPQLEQLLTANGAKAAGHEVYNILRVEAGTPQYGLDIDETNLPQEVGRDARALSFAKGCYLGQEPIVRIRDLGHVNRRLMGLQLQGDESAPIGAKLFRGGQEVGKVTSSVWSPRLGAIALAYVRRGHQEPGTAVEVDIGTARRPAVVRPLPGAAVTPAGG